MKTLTEYLKFHTKTHRAYVHITPQVEADRQQERRAGRHGAGFGHAHHGGHLRQRQ